MEAKQYILLSMIVVFGFGFYLAITMQTLKYEDSYCGQYESQRLAENYDKCIDAGRPATICEGETAQVTSDEMQGMEESECQEKLED